MRWPWWRSGPRVGLTLRPVDEQEVLRGLAVPESHAVFQSALAVIRGEWVMQARNAQVAGDAAERTKGYAMAMSALEAVELKLMELREKAEKSGRLEALKNQRRGRA